MTNVNLSVISLSFLAVIMNVQGSSVFNAQQEASSNLAQINPWVIMGQIQKQIADMNKMQAENEAKRRASCHVVDSNTFSDKYGYQTVTITTSKCDNGEIITDTETKYSDGRVTKNSNSSQGGSNSSSSSSESGSNNGSSSSSSSSGPGPNGGSSSSSSSTGGPGSSSDSAPISKQSSSPASGPSSGAPPPAVASSGNGGAASVATAGGGGAMAMSSASG